MRVVRAVLDRQRGSFSFPRKRRASGRGFVVPENRERWRAEAPVLSAVMLSSAWTLTAVAVGALWTLCGLPMSRRVGALNPPAPTRAAGG